MFQTETIIFPTETIKSHPPYFPGQRRMAKVKNKIINRIKFVLKLHLPRHLQILDKNSDLVSIDKDDMLYEDLTKIEINKRDGVCDNDIYKKYL